MFSLFFIFDTLIDVEWYLIVVLIYISLAANDVEHPYMCICVTCKPSLVKCLIMSFVHFVMELFYVFIFSSWKCKFCLLIFYHATLLNSCILWIIFCRFLDIFYIVMSHDSFSSFCLLFHYSPLFQWLEFPVRCQKWWGQTSLPCS